MTCAMDPFVSSSLGSFDKKADLTHFIPNDDYASFKACFRPPERPRTEKRDNTGDRVGIRTVLVDNEGSILSVSSEKSSGGFQKNTKMACISKFCLNVFSPIHSGILWSVPSTHNSIPKNDLFSSCFLGSQEVIVGTSGGHVLSYSLEQNLNSTRMIDSGKPILSLAGDFLGSFDGRLYMCDGREKKIQEVFKTEFPLSRCLRRKEQNQVVLAAGNLIHVVDVRNPAKSLVEKVFQENITDIDVSSNGRIAFSCFEKGIFQFSLENEDQKIENVSVVQSATSVQFVGDQNLAVSTLQCGLNILSVDGKNKLNIPIEGICSSFYEGHSIACGTVNGKMLILRAEQNRNHLAWHKLLN